jgi:hypothetical protein
MWTERGNQNARYLTEKQSDAEDGGCYEPLMHGALNLLKSTFRGGSI